MGTEISAGSDSKSDMMFSGVSSSGRQRDNLRSKATQVFADDRLHLAYPGAGTPWAPECALEGVEGDGVSEQVESMVTGGWLEFLVWEAA